MRARLYIWVLIAVLAGATWWLASSRKSAPGGPETAAAPHQVDYYLRDLRATTMSDTGEPARTLVAKDLRHYADDRTTELSQPELTVYQGPQPPWLIVSDDGWISADGSLVLLGGEVHITRDAGDDNRPMRIDTRDLRIQPREDYAETDEKVRVRSERDRIDATGMQAWLRSPARIKFLANVKGYYASP
jgi:lipopolysaccharide export system protein LptC